MFLFNISYHIVHTFFYVATHYDDLLKCNTKDFKVLLSKPKYYIVDGNRTNGHVNIDHPNAANLEGGHENIEFLSVHSNDTRLTITEYHKKIRNYEETLPVSDNRPKTTCSKDYCI